MSKIIETKYVLDWLEHKRIANPNKAHLLESNYELVYNHYDKLCREFIKGVRISSQLSNNRTIQNDNTSSKNETIKPPTAYNIDPVPDYSDGADDILDSIFDLISDS